MRISLISLFKPIALGIVAVSVMTLGQNVTRADEVFIAGNTNGCFGVGCIPPSTGGAPQMATFLGLTFHNSTFDGTTAGGFLGIGATATPPANMDNLGSFTLTDLPALYTGQQFTLRVTFTDPEGIVGPPTQTFTASVMGQVFSNDVGGVTIDFNNTPILFTFNDTTCQPTTIPGQQTRCGVGSFMFRVNDVSLQAPEMPGGLRVVAVTGDVLSAQQTVIPEPTGMLLLGTGLVGAAGIVRKLRARNQN